MRRPLALSSATVQLILNVLLILLFDELVHFLQGRRFLVVGLCCAGALARLAGGTAAKLAEPALGLRLGRRLAMRVVVHLLLLLPGACACLLRLRLLRSKLAQKWINLMIVVERAARVHVCFLLALFLLKSNVLRIHRLFCQGGGDSARPRSGASFSAH